MSDPVTVRDAPTAGGDLRYVLVPGEAVRLALPGYGRVTVGRGEGNDVVLHADGVEEAHALLHVDDYGIQVEALESGVRLLRQGTSNEVTVGHPLDVEDDDRVAVGEAVLAFVVADSPKRRARVWSRSTFDADLAEVSGDAALWYVSGDAAAIERAIERLHRSAYRIQVDGVVILERDIDASTAQRLGAEITACLEGVECAVGFAHSTRVAVDHLLAAAASRTSAPPTSDVIFVGERLRDVLALADRLATTTAPVLVLGETGTGKNIVARRIHERSRRSPGPFVTVNSQELDGEDNRNVLADWLPRAAGGTLVLDEVSALPHLAQLGLGRFLEQLEADPGAPDVRIVATTNRNLDVDDETHSFRLDLLFRLNRGSVRLPPLRDFPGDLPDLARSLLARLAAGRDPVELSDRAVAVLQRYRWPGNVRQLESALERALLVCDGTTIDAEHLPVEVRRGKAREPDAGQNLTLKDEVAALEKRRILEALETHASQAAAARALGMPLRTFVTRMDAYAIPRARAASKDEEE